MFTVNDDMSIYVTRGDTVFFTVSAFDGDKNYTFQPGDIVRIKVFGKKDCETILMQKSFAVEEETESVNILLTGDETKFGDVINKPTDYWYEIELNPYTNPQTIIGYDDDGAKVFKLFPEGKDALATDPKNIPVVDPELDLTSERPVQNQAIARALIQYEERVEEAKETINATADEAEQRVSASIGRIEEKERKALVTVQNATLESAQHAQRAKEEADRASSIVGGDFASKADVENCLPKNFGVAKNLTIGASDALGGDAGVDFVDMDEEKQATLSAVNNEFVRTHPDGEQWAMLDAENYGNHVHSVSASNGEYSAVMQDDGNLVVYKNADGSAEFSTKNASMKGHIHAATDIVGVTGIKTASATTSTTHGTGDNHLIASSFLSYWNGAYGTGGASNLAYCNKGAFGTGATTNITHGTGELTTGTSALPTGDIYIQYE